MNERGFSIVDGFLAATLVAALGLGGWYVLSQNKSELQPTEQVENEGVTFTTYESDFGFSIQYPEGYALSRLVLPKDDFGGIGEPIVFKAEEDPETKGLPADGESLVIELIKNDDVDLLTNDVALNSIDDLLPLVQQNRDININDENPNLEQSYGEIEELSVAGGKAYYYEARGGYNYGFDNFDLGGMVVEEPLYVGFASDGSTILHFRYEVDDSVAEQMIQSLQFTESSLSETDSN